MQMVYRGRTYSGGLAVTPYEERMKQSRERKSRILRLSRKPGMSHQKIADEVQCSRAYVTQTINAAKEKGK